MSRASVMADQEVVAAIWDDEPERLFMRVTVIDGANWHGQLAGSRYDTKRMRLIYHHHDPHAASQDNWLYQAKRTTERFLLVRDHLVMVLDLERAERYAALLGIELRDG
jgi:hypothetical protein